MMGIVAGEKGINKVERGRLEAGTLICPGRPVMLSITITSTTTPKTGLRPPAY